MSKSEKPEKENKNENETKMGLSDVSIGDNNSIGNTEQSITEKSYEIPLQTNDQYNGALVFYRFMSNLLPNQYQSHIFGGAGIGGLGLFLFHSLTNRGSTLEISNLPFFDWVYWVSGFAAIIGLGYFFISGKCENCGAPFSMEHLDSRQIEREQRSNKADRIRVQEEYKCQNCFHEETRTDWKIEDRGSP